MEKNSYHKQEMFNIASLFIEQAKVSPNRMAIATKSASKSFSELHADVEQYIGYLQSKGVEKGDRVLIFAPMGLAMYTALLALLRIGAIVVFLDEWSGIERLNVCCREAKCKGFLSGFKGRLVGLLSSEVRKIPVKLRLKTTGYNNSNILPPVNTIKEDTALITFTTGSSGIPKAANRTHGFLWEQFKVLREEIDPELCPVNMPVLPIVLLINLACGISSVIADYKAQKPESFKPERILRQLKAYNVKSISSSPYFIIKMAEYVLERNLVNEQSSLKQIFTGGGAVMPKEAVLLEQAFPNSETKVLYGSTEAEPISTIEVGELAHNVVAEDGGLLVGEVSKHAQVRIIEIVDRPIEIEDAESFEKLALEEGAIGEIVVSGPHVLDNYFNNPEALRRNKIRYGNTCWHRTGDSGFLTNGKLFLTGPCHGLIQKHDAWLSLFIYEYLLGLIEGVEIGTILQIEGKVVAVVQSKGPISQIQNSILELPFVDQVMQLPKIPRDPRHHTKIDYGRLKQLVM